jgi:CRP/FNR family transcriptional regulator, dissimilatory nitrate respiration regulator
MDAFGLAQAPRMLRAKLRTRTLARDAMLFRQGDPVRAVYVVETGRIAMVRHTPDGRRVRLFSAGAGESFAEAALFSDTYHCDAVAEIASRVIVIPKAELRALLARQRRRAEALESRLAHQVQELRLRLELRDIRRARERVWQMLMLASGPNGRTLTFDRPLKDVAAEIGLTHEAFYRALAALARAGHIRRRGRHIEVMSGKI